MNAEDVVLTHERVFVVVDFDFGAAVFADENLVADLDFEGGELAGFVLLAGAEGDDFRLLWLLFGAVRDDDPAARLALLLRGASRGRDHRWV